VSVLPTDARRQELSRDHRTPKFTMDVAADSLEISPFRVQFMFSVSWNLFANAAQDFQELVDQVSEPSV
jgi:hypothetical protein